MKRTYFALCSLSLTLISTQAQEPLIGVIAKQGETRQVLAEHPQSIMFLKSDETDPKAAVANLLITQVGMPLLTMGLSTQMRMWNPYMGDTFNKAANLGKSMLSGHGNDTKGFEYEMIRGITASTTLHPGTAEFVIPIDRYAAPDDADMQPVLVRLDPRPKDQTRVISARHVVLKENKKGRFDLKPTVERQEGDVQQQTVATEVHREEGNILRITTAEPLDAGEYALLLRKKSDTGQYTSNVALRSAPAEASQTTPVAIGAAAQKPHFGAAMMLHRPVAPSSPQPQEQMTGFIAWDFRVQ